MAKKGGKTSYKSKGERPNVSKKIRNAVRQEKARLNPIAYAIRRTPLEKEIMTKVSKNSKLSDVEKVVYERMQVQKRAIELHDRWKDVATYAACVQAVKTDWIGSFEAKCHDLKSAGFVI